MKTTTIYLLFGILFLFSCESGNHLQRVTLTNKMYSFFTATLHENYYSVDEEDLYRRFLSDYMNSKETITKLDHEKMYVICDELLKRDSTHYYFYYPEFIEYKSECKGTNNSLVFFKEKYGNVPLVVNKVLWQKDTVMKSVNDCPVVYLNTEPNGYLNGIDTLDYPSIGIVKSNYESRGQLELLNLARFYTEGEGVADLKEKEVRKFLAVAYWKVLCANVNADFHGISDAQKKKYIKELLQTEKLLGSKN